MKNLLFGFIKICQDYKAPLLLLISFSHSIFAQISGPCISWEEKYQSLGLSNVPGDRIEETNDGGFILGGTSLSSDFWVAKIDNAGLIQWEKTFGGSKFDQLFVVHQTSDSGYILGGTTYSTDGDVTSGNHSDNADLWVMKLDKDGSLQWEKAYGGSSWEFFRALYEIPTGDYILAGVTSSTDGDIQSSISGFVNAWLVKLNSTGDIIWEKTYFISGYDELGFLFPDNGDYLLGVNKISLQYEFFDPGVIKINGDGEILWTTILTGGDFGALNQVQKDLEGNYYLGLNILNIINSESADSDFYIVKMNNNGEILWEKILGEPTSDLKDEDLKDLKLNADGNIVALANRRFYQDSWINQIDPDGNILWTKSLNGTGEDYLTILTILADGNYLLGGYTNSNDGDIQSGNKGKNDLWLVKTHNAGEVIWERTFGGSENEEMNSILLSNSEYIVTAHTESNDGNIHSTQEGNLWVLRIAEETMCTEEPLVPPPLSLNNFDVRVKIFPNPVDRLELTVEIPFNLPVKLVLTDMKGLVVLEETLNQFSNCILLNDVKDGVYVVHLLNRENLLHRQKIVKMGEKF